MQSEACKALRKQGYQFFSPRSSAALKPCMWNKRTLRGGDMCYKAQFYGIESHRCVQMTPTLKCNQRCLFCWRSMEYEVVEEEECPPELIMERLLPLQKKALAGYNPVANDAIDQKLWEEALAPDMAAVSLSGEPTLYSHLPRLFDLLNDAGFTTFLVTNGTRPDMVRRCSPYQTYVSLDGPDEETYQRVCRPMEDSWEQVKESLSLLGSRRSAIRITVVKGLNDISPEGYARLIQDAGPVYVEVKGYMYLGYSRNRLTRAHMPSHEYVAAFANEITKYCDYEVYDESPVSRVVCLTRGE